MNFSTDKHMQKIIKEFVERYGTSGLEQALKDYENLQQEYICKNKSAVSKVKICDIYYLEIKGHKIHVHTEHGTFQKYGSLRDELKLLSMHGFVKCNQSCLVSLHKIQSLLGNDIVLTNREHLYMSRHYAPSVLIAFSRSQKQASVSL